MLLITLLILLLFVCYLYCKKRLNYWNDRGVANLQPKTPFGDLINCVTDRKNIFVLLKDVYNEFKNQGHKYAGFYFTLGPVFLPIDRELIKKILVTDHDEYFSERGAYMDKQKLPLSDNLFFVDGTRWKYLREMLGGTLSPSKVNGMVHIVENYAKVLCDILSQTEGPVDIYNLAQRYTLDIACTAYLGLNEENLRENKSPIIDFAGTMNTCSLKNVLKVCLTDGITNPANLAVSLIIDKKLNTFFYDYVRKAYELRKKASVKAHYALDKLIEYYENEDEDFDFNSLVGQVLMLFGTTYETNVSAITYVLYELGRRKDYQDEIRNEIRAAIKKNNGALDCELILNMEVLDHFMLETLRTHPTLPAINRSCVKDYQIPGTNTVIEKGTPVVISTYAIHNDPDIFPDPNEFNPNRFLDNNQKQSLMIFGMGKKYCLGKRLGLTVIKTALVEILKNYEVSVDERTGSKLENTVFSRHLIWKYKNTIWLNFKRCVQ